MDNISSLAIFQESWIFYVILSLFIISIISCFLDSDKKVPSAYCLSTLVAMVAYLEYKSDLNNDWINYNSIAIYLVVGCIYFFIRVYFLGRNYVDRNYAEEETRIKYRMEYLWESIGSNIIYWWFLFPLSFIEWALSDLSKVLTRFVNSLFKSLVEKLFNLGANK